MVHTQIPLNLFVKFFTIGIFDYFSYLEYCQILMCGGEFPRNSAYNSEILQSESLAEVSCPISSIIDPFLDRPNSHINNDAYKLKVEKMKTDVLGRSRGDFYFFLLDYTILGYNENV